MRLLITGATGFAGNALLDVLPGAVPAARLRLFVLPGDPGLPRVLSRGIPGLEIVEGNITDQPAVASAMKGATHVIHLAGLISYWRKDRDRLMLVNRDGARIVAEAAAREKVLRLVHVSSVGAIGFHPDGRLADESTPFNWPDSFPYMTTKHAGQQAVEEAARHGGLKAIILNPASLMGPGDPDPASAHNQLYRSIAGGPLFGCFSGGLAVTDVRDLAALIVKALTKGRPGEKYLAVGSNATYVDVVRSIGRCFGRPVFPFRVPPFLLTAAGGLMELVSAVTGRRPLLTAAYGKLSGWHAYYSNARSTAAFEHTYMPLSRTIADGCAFYAATHGRAVSTRGG
jgi:dihydroflavonol-4-reductase